ncbi:MAG: trehalose-phosphatase [Deltaproteobacteria bacterium]|nr:trehalose-phosphatase [Deltaproteobacteria bacterium]
MPLPHYLLAGGQEGLTHCYRSASLFLCTDYDGTLVPIAQRPHEAQPGSRLLSLLSDLVQSPGMEVAVVSGRPVAELRTLLPLSGLWYVGLHGLEMLTPRGKKHLLTSTAATDMIIRRLQEKMQQIVATAPGCVLEDKGHTLALHFRLACQSDAVRVTGKFLADVQAYQKKGVALQTIRGKKVIEVRPLAANKGKALSVLMQSKQTCPIYLGDDETDEEAFGALNHRGITVLVADPPRPTAARFYLRSPAEVEEFFLLLLRLRRQIPA